MCRYMSVAAAASLVTAVVFLWPVAEFQPPEAVTEQEFCESLVALGWTGGSPLGPCAARSKCSYSLNYLKVVFKGII